MLSSNADFSENGQAAIIRDLERHELLLMGNASSDLGTSTGDTGPLAVNQATGVGPVVLTDQNWPNYIELPIVDYPISVPDGGTGATSLTGYVKGAGTSALTGSSSVPWSDLSGVPTTFQATLYSSRTDVTSNGTFTVPAGIKQIRITMVGGGGGGGGAPDVTHSATGYIAATSGAAATTLIYNHGTTVGGGGGSGASIVVDLSVTPGEVLTCTIGAGGAAGTVGGFGTGGTDGGDTVVVDSGSMSLTAGGGGGGSFNHLAAGGNAGRPTITIGGRAMAWTGFYGRVGLPAFHEKSTSTTASDYSVSMTPTQAYAAFPVVSRHIPTSNGAGGAGGSTWVGPQAGYAGVVVIQY